jgi:hypothetical protein
MRKHLGTLRSQVLKRDSGNLYACQIDNALATQEFPHCGKEPIRASAVFG